MNKKSPYGIFLNHALLRMFENGQLHNIKKKWEVLPPQCSPLIKKGKSLSFSKLISLFTIIGIGGTLAMMVMVCEFIKGLRKPRGEPIGYHEIQQFKFILREVQECFKNDEIPSKELLISLRTSSSHLTKPLAKTLLEYYNTISVLRNA